MEILLKIRNNNTKRSAKLSNIMIPVLFPALKSQLVTGYLPGLVLFLTGIAYTPVRLQCVN